MADVSNIDNAVLLLSEILDAKHVNFFDQATLEDLARPLGQWRYIIATGSYACGEWRYGDNVRLVCMTQNTRETFWSYVVEKLELKNQPNLFHPLNAVMELSDPFWSRTIDNEDSILSNFMYPSKKTVLGCKFYLHYCQIPAGFEPVNMAMGKPGPRYNPYWRSKLTYALR